MSSLLNTPIQVTKEHIARGVQMDCHRCPVALAIKELRPRSLVVVSLLAITVGRTSYEVPEKVSEFMDKFDDGKGRKVLEPFSFELVSTRERPIGD